MRRTPLMDVREFAKDIRDHFHCSRDSEGGHKLYPEECWHCYAKRTLTRLRRLTAKRTRARRK